MKNNNFLIELISKISFKNTKSSSEKSAAGIEEDKEKPKMNQVNEEDFDNDMEELNEEGVEEDPKFSKPHNRTKTNVRNENEVIQIDGITVSIPKPKPILKNLSKEIANPSVSSSKSEKDLNDLNKLKTKTSNSSDKDSQLGKTKTKAGGIGLFSNLFKTATKASSHSEFNDDVENISNKKQEGKVKEFEEKTTTTCKGKNLDMEMDMDLNKKNSRIEKDIFELSNKKDQEELKKLFTKFVDEGGEDDEPHAHADGSKDSSIEMKIIDNNNNNSTANNNKTDEGSLDASTSSNLNFIKDDEAETGNGKFIYYKCNS